MKNNYRVSLVNYYGVVFDCGHFTNLKVARRWATGRGETYDMYGDCWHKYTVVIDKNDELFMEYMTK